MKMTADQEARVLIGRVCDAALRAGGMNVFNDVSNILGCLMQGNVSPPKVIEPSKEKGDKNATETNDDGLAAGSGRANS